MSISTVVTMGYEIGSMGLVTTLGYGQGAAPPPPPPVQTSQVYGPALTPAERERWFGTYDYCPPDERERLRKERERAKRLELGIIKALPVLRPDIRPEVVLVVQERVVEALPQIRVRLDEKQIISSIARELSLELKAVLREGRDLRELHRVRELKRIEDEEEEEAVEVLSLWMLQ